MVAFLPQSVCLVIYFVCFRHDQGRARELCESPGGRPGLPVLNKPYGFCGRTATLNLNISRAVHPQEVSKWDAEH